MPIYAALSIEEKKPNSKQYISCLYIKTRVPIIVIQNSNETFQIQKLVMKASGLNTPIFAL